MPTMTENIELENLIRTAISRVLEGYWETEKKVADREGFEPSVRLPQRILSRDVVSANSPICPQKVDWNYSKINIILYLRELTCKESISTCKSIYQLIGCFTSPP